MSTEQTAKDYWFFLSYAKRDARSNIDVDGVSFVKRFFTELANQLAAKLAKPTETQPGEVAFFDESGIEAGGSAYAEMTEGLAASRVMVCLFSPAYFQREYCGKETEYFRLRQDEWMKTYKAAQPPKVIVPVYWENPADTRKLIPEFFSKSSIEIVEHEAGVEYANLGLKYLLKQSGQNGGGRHYGDYQEFLENFARMLVQKGQYASTQPMPKPKGSPSIENIQHKFPASAGTSAAKSAAAKSSSSAKGPGVAKFFYVAARRDEFDPQEPRRDLYGDNGWPDWQPFNPPVNDEVWVFAQRAATDTKVRYLDDDFDDIEVKLKAANDDNVVAVVVVDAWSLKLKRYRELMEKCDGISYKNTVIIVVRNADDQTVASSVKDLQAWLELAFPTKSESRDKKFFVNPVQSRGELQKRLREAIKNARDRILRYNEGKRLAESESDNSIPILPASGVSV
jgi:FxsC-like protein